MYRLKQFIRLSVTPMLIIAILLLIGGGTVAAAEITPDPTSYSYGSTSEISPSSTITTNPSSLASTGDPANIIKIAAVVLILTGVGFGARAILKKRKA